MVRIGNDIGEREIPWYKRERKDMGKDHFSVNCIQYMSWISSKNRHAPQITFYDIKLKVIAHSISIIVYSTSYMTSFGPLFFNGQLLVTYVQKLHKHLFHWISSVESMVVASVSRHRNTLACMVCLVSLLSFIRSALPDSPKSFWNKINKLWCCYKWCILLINPSFELL